MSKYKSGDLVTPKTDLPGYYSGYGDRKEFSLRSGDSAVILNPKVTKVRYGKCSRKQIFILVEFYSRETKEKERAGICPCNVKRFVSTYKGDESGNH